MTIYISRFDNSNVLEAIEVSCQSEWEIGHIKRPEATLLLMSIFCQRQQLLSHVDDVIQLEPVLVTIISAVHSVGD